MMHYFRLVATPILMDWKRIFRKNIVYDIKTASDYIKNRLRYTICYTELLAARLAFEAAKQQNLEKINELETIMNASIVPMELREAAKKLGSRFIKTLTYMQVPYITPIFLNYKHAI